MKRSPLLRKTPMRHRKLTRTLRDVATNCEQGDMSEVLAPVMHARQTRKANSGPAQLTARPKRTPIRSAKLLAAVRQLPCMVSGAQGRTQAAHSNWSQHGKGRSQKADDNRVAALSDWWHFEIDQGSTLSGEQRQDIWWKAHIATVRELLRRKRWPAGVPIPQLDDFWKP